MFRATQSDAKRKLVQAQEYREGRVINYLAPEATRISVSSGTYEIWDLNSTKIRGILRNLEDGRTLEASRGYFRGAARSKPLKRRKLRLAVSLRRNEADP